jgi:hypothetical protein
MWRKLLSQLAALIVVAATCLPVAHAQHPPMRIEYDATTGEKKERGPPALQYSFAAFSTIIVMVILCMPSRKRAQGT